MLRETVRVPWRMSLLALAVAVASTPPARPAKRVAVRVSCAEPAACVVAESLALDVWSEERGPGMPLDVVVPETALPALAGFAPEIIDPDIDATARAEADRLRSPSAADRGDWFAEYKDYDAIAEHLRGLAAEAPDRVALQAIGGSIEGRPIWAVRIGHMGPDVTPILVNGTQHAREWIAAMTTTCVADRLVRDYDRDPAIRAFVDRTELWVVPVVNPDGYDYTWGTDRYWRKNRRGGYGVDLNRNFGVAWGGDGSSGSKRSDVYRGEYAFSEPESQALRDLAKREGIAVHVDFHSYSQLLLYPWGYTASPAKDRDRFAAVGDRMASAMYAQHGMRYALMQSVELYPASGTMEDWMYGELGAQSFTIELRPKGRGRNGFVLPPDQIRPTCDEALAALLALRDAH